VVAEEIEHAVVPRHRIALHSHGPSTSAFAQGRPATCRRNRLRIGSGMLHDPGNSGPAQRARWVSGCGREATHQDRWQRLLPTRAALQRLPSTFDQGRRAGGLYENGREGDFQVVDFADVQTGRIGCPVAF